MLILLYTFYTQSPLYIQCKNLSWSKTNWEQMLYLIQEDMDSASVYWRACAMGPKTWNVCYSRLACGITRTLFKAQTKTSKKNAWGYEQPSPLRIWIRRYLPHLEVKLGFVWYDLWYRSSPRTIEENTCHPVLLG